MPERNTYHSRGDFFWAIQEENETPEEHWKKLITPERNCAFLISKFIKSPTKNSGRLNREETISLKTTVEHITQNSYDRRHKQSIEPPALVKYKEIKQESIQKFQTRQHREQRKIPKSSDCGS